MKITHFAAIALMALAVPASPSIAQEKDKDAMDSDGCDKGYSIDYKTGKCVASVSEAQPSDINPRTDLEIYQPVCIDPATNMLWGRDRTVGAKDGDMDAYGLPVPRSTARCQPGHDPRYYLPNGRPTK